jgi:hypothetical protein
MSDRATHIRVGGAPIRSVERRWGGDPDADLRPASFHRQLRNFDGSPMAAVIVSENYARRLVLSFFVRAVAIRLVLREPASANPHRQFSTFWNFVGTVLFMPDHSSHGFFLAILMGADSSRLASRGCSAIKDYQRRIVKPHDLPELDRSRHRRLHDG